MNLHCIFIHGEEAVDDFHQVAAILTYNINQSDDIDRNLLIHFN